MRVRAYEKGKKRFPSGCVGVAVNRIVYFVHASIVDCVVMDRCGQQHRAGAPWPPPLLPVLLPVRYHS